MLSKTTLYGSFSPRNKSNIDYYRWRNIPSLASGLQSLQLVESFVKASLYGSFVAGELKEGVWSIGVSDVCKT